MRSRECGSWECRSWESGVLALGGGAVLLLGRELHHRSQPSSAHLGPCGLGPHCKERTSPGPCGIQAHCPQTLFSVRPFRIPPLPLGSKLFPNRCRNLQVSLTSLGRGKVRAGWAHICAGWGTGGVEEAAQLAGPRTVRLLRTVWP